MKKIVFVRHAKANKNDVGPDKERPLTPRAVECTKAVVSSLSSEGIVFGCVATSPAVRAVDTARIFAETIGGSDALVIIPEWYESMTIKSLGTWICGIPSYIDTAVVVGHNPDLLLVIQHFDPSFNDHISPAGTIVMRFPTDAWNAVPSLKGEILSFKVPADAGDFKERLKIKEGEIAERIAVVTMRSLKGIPGINIRLCEKNIYDYAARLAEKAVKDMSVVTVIGMWN
jgi:phosphohistidine phosphatase